MNTIDKLKRLQEMTPANRDALLKALSQKASQTDAANKIPGASRDQALALSFAQQRLWFIDQLDPGNWIYNMPLAIALSGSLNTDALARTLNEIVRRHEVLRTTFRMVDAETVQIIHAHQPFTLEMTSLEHVPVGERDEQVRQLAEQEAVRPFDLAAGPVLRASLLKLGDSEHVALLTMHHIVSDEWSMGLMIREVAALYGAYAAGQPSPLPELQIQYADFAVWQRDWLRGETLAKQLNYWRDQVAGLTTLQLPVDRPRPPVQSYRGAEVAFRVSAEVTQSLNALSRREGGTLFMALLTAWQLLLARYSGQDDIVIGSPIAGRNRKETEDLIGFFLNTLIMRSDLSGNPSVAELLARVREVCLGAYAHQDIPFEQLVDSLHPERDLSRHPLFQVLFDLHNMPAGNLGLKDLTLRVLASEQRTAKFDLTLFLTETPDGMAGVIEYATDLFDPETAERMAGHLQNLLQGIAADPARRISDLAMLSAAESHQLLVAWNDTHMDCSLDVCVHELFARQATRTPGAIAAVCGDQTLTYAELNAKANQLARHLQTMGIGPEVRVGLCIERSLDMVVGILGILKAGAAYVPLDPELPAERLAFILADSGIPAMVTQEKLLDGLALENVYIVVCLDRDWDDIAQSGVIPSDSGPGTGPGAMAVALDSHAVSDSPSETRERNDQAELSTSSENPVSGAGPQNLAYVIYTSGSTGTPKGVGICHGGLTNYLTWSAQAYDVTSGDGTPVQSSLGFDLTVTSLFPALISGQKVVLLPEEQPHLELLRMLREPGDWTLFKITPAHLAVLGEGLKDGDNLGGVQSLVVGGEALHAGDLATWRTHWNSIRIVNEYGPTETVVGCCVYDVPDVLPADVVPIGRPIWNTDLYVLDSEFRPVPIGVPGELYIGGAGVARGYLGRPGLTAERFVPHPFSGAPGGARLYQTGDLCRYLRDGNLEYLGRTDHQVKIRGFRIELGEIEAALSQMPSVHSTAVIVREDNPGDKRLVAYVAANAEQTIDAAALRAALGARLPEYMVPAAFVVLDALPLTANGKVDRKALPAPERDARQIVGEIPQTPVEELIASLWSDMLRVDKIGRDDDFFKLGGHSLLATQVVSRVRSVLGVEVPLHVLFEAPVLTEFAARVVDIQREADGLQVPGIAPQARGGALPVSFAQQRLWFIDHLEPGSSAYNLPVAVKLSGTLNVEALEKTIDEIVRRHESLRTTFTTDGAQPVQVIHAHQRFVLPVTSLEHLPEEERDSQARDMAQREAARPFDLAQGPLLRVSLLQLGDQEHVALLTMHHIVSDEWSMGVLITEIGALYDAYAAGRPSPLPEPVIQYADFAVWQRQWLQGPVLEKQLKYWQAQLADLPTLQLPTDHPRPAVQSYRGASTSFMLTPDVTQAVSALSRREGATLFMTLLAAWQLLLSRYSGQSDIVVGSPIAGRNRAEVEGLIGFFVNTQVLRGDVSGNPEFVELMRRVRATSLAAYGHQDIPFEQLVDSLAPARDLSRHPLFQVTLALQNTKRDTLALADITLHSLATEQHAAKFDLSVTVTELANGMHVNLDYATDLYELPSMIRMAGHFSNLLTHIAAFPETRIGDVPFLSDSERHQLVVAFNDTHVDFPLDLCAHHLFEQHAERTPGAIALISDEETLTYAELNSLSNQLAHHLKSLGVGPGVHAGFCLPRTNAAFIAMLGVLKAGGAYVPLDPEYPDERLLFMLRDVKAKVLLTTAEIRDRLQNASAADPLAHLHYASPPGASGSSEQDIRLPLLTKEGVGGRLVPAIVLLDDPASWRSETATHNPDGPLNPISPLNLAYSIFTSGSTGPPKAVVITHKSLLNLVFWHRATYDVTAEDRATQIASFAFDASVWEIWPFLTAGASMCIATGAARLSAPHYLEWVNQHRVTISIVPVALGHLLRDHEPWPETSMRSMQTGGDQVRHNWPADRPPLYNHYGPTEDTVLATYGIIGPVDELPSIGGPLSNVQVYVLDRFMQPVPLGVAGELYVGGASLSIGYYNRPELTATRFVSNPFSTEPGERMYRTGDLVRWRGFNDIEYLGRIDHQVKIRGFRIELGEVETTLVRHPEINAAVALVHEDNTGHRRLVAYIVADSGQPMDVTDLRAFLKTRLPDYMIPAAFVFLDAFPATPNGKLDRKALPDPWAGQLEDYAAPRSTVEETLAAIWASVLGIPRVGIHDNFFASGGDSILSILIVARANQAGIALTPRLMFQYQTVAELAAVCGSLEAPLADQGIVTGPVPLTPIQRWFFARRMVDQHHYNHAVLVRTEPRLTPEILATAVSRLAAHHDALRIRFTPAPEGWLAENAGVDEGGSALFSAVDLSEYDASEQRSVLEQAAEQLQGSLDLVAGPLMKVRLYTYGPDQPGRLLIVAHHLVIDGVSWRILLEDLQTACNQLLDGAPVTLPAKTTSFQRWSELHREYAHSDGISRESAYWTSLPWAAVHPLPVDSAVHGADLARLNTVGTEKTVTEVLAAESTKALLHEAPEAYHTQINDILLAALSATLCRWAGQEHVLLALEGHGREDLFESVDIGRTIGWFTTIFPVFLHWTPETEPGDLLISTKESLRAIPERGIGYGVLRHLTGDAALADAPEPGVTFNYLGQFDQALGDGALFGRAPENAGATLSPRNARPALLDVSAVVAGGQLRVTWTYSDQLHNAQTIHALATAYRKELEALIAHCLSPGAGAYTPSDFPDAQLSREQLARIISGLDGAVPEAIYPLSPTQQGMLFHTLYAPNSGEYINQVLFDLRGPLDIAAFTGSWRHAVDHHDILRTGFVWQGLAEPVQVVVKHLDLAVEQRDWSHLGHDEQERESQVLLARDAEDGFALSRAPLMRLILIRMEPGRTRVLWTHHHLLLDGWCIPVLIAEVFAGYQAIARGEAYNATRPRPYREYIQWLRKQDTAKAEAYWRGVLSQFDSPTPLPDTGVHQVEPGAGHHGELSFSIAPDLSARAAAFAQQNQVTLNTLMQGAWSVLLSRHSGQENILFGATVSNRPAAIPGIETMLGLFINVLPVHVHIPGAEPVSRWLQALQADQAERSEYEYSSLTSVHGCSGVPRETPLFETVISFQNYPVVSVVNESRREQGVSELIDTAGGPLFETVDVRQPTNYPLAIDVVPGTEIVLRFDYLRSRFTPEAVARLAERWNTLLARMVENPEAKVGGLSLLSDAERHQILVEFNATRAEFARDVCVHQVFTTQAARTPDATALIFEDQSLSYAELNARANQMAHYLQDWGVGPDVRVGLLIERSVEMVIGMLGILKAGGAYVPLAPDLPGERLDVILDDAQVPVMLTSGKLADTVSLGQTQIVISIDRDWPSIAESGRENPVADVNPQNLAYVIFTSGSTGKPKGVCIGHGALANHMTWMQAAFGWSAGHRVLQKTPFGFDASVWEFYAPLLGGGALIMASPGGHHDPTYLIDTISRMDVNVLQVVPSLLNMLLLEGEFARCGSLQYLFCGGEILPPDLVEQVLGHMPGLRLDNLFGPTEATIDATSARCVLEGGRASVSIGSPIANTQVYILDQDMSPVPINIDGELCIGGDGLARGYLNSPALTAEKFVPNPFCAEPGGRLYRSGDIGRYLDGGNIKFTGRLDNQVKMRGFRIELGEIETVLARHPMVAASAVIDREDEPGDKRLVAYVVPGADQRAAASDLRAFLTAALPDYMVPSAFVFLEAMPLTHNGKLDRRLLPAPDRQDGQTDGETPRTPVEELVAQIWSDVLHIGPFGRNENFFTLGGHSLLGTQVISRIRHTFHCDLPLQALFEAATLAEFSKRLEDYLSESDGLLAPPIVPSPREDAPPLSFAQQRLWIIDQIEPDNAAYNVPVALTLTGSLDTDALERTINEIARRHEVLRTTFDTVVGRLVQVIHPHAPFPVEITSLEDMPEETRNAYARQLAREEARRPFDLSQGPLMRARLLRLSEREHVALLTLHHIVSDGWSMGLLVKEASALYNAFADGRPSPLPELAVQYADFAVWQRNWLRGDVLDAQLAYWTNQLADLPVLELPTDRPRPAVQSYRGGDAGFRLSPDVTASLKEIARREGATLFMTLLAAWQLLLSRYTGQEDIVTGSPIAGRNRAETENLIGFFINTLVMRADLNGNLAFSELLRQTRATALGAYAHQDLPFEHLVEEIAPARDLSRHPLFQVLFDLHNAPSETLSLGDVALGHLDSGLDVVKFDLTLILTETAAGLGGDIGYAVDLFDPATVERMAGHLRNLLSSIAADPGRRISSLMMLSEAERDQLLFTWNDTRVSVDDLCVHERVARQAAATPNAIAVVCADQTLTYGELNTRANQLAHYLQEQGVGPEVLIGLLIDRSLDMIVALLGILKAGGAYVPLDPELPSERLAAILTDSAVPVLVTKSKWLENISLEGTQIIVCLDQDADAIARASAHDPVSGVSGENLAYALYTSGSTGTPKGVAIRHGGLANYLNWSAQAYNVADGDGTPVHSSLGFDLTITSLFPALISGQRILLLPEEQSHLELKRLLREGGDWTLFKITPAHLAILGEGWSHENVLGGVRSLVIGGEALHGSDLAVWREHAPGTRLINEYGPTETVVGCCVYEAGETLPGGGVPIGRPIWNTELYVLDRDMAPVPAGVPGELYIGGAGLARGYLGRPGQTAESFVPHPFSQSEGARLYRSGDICRYLSDGNLEYLGRADHQVKIRGYRIELGEIEAQLLRHPAVESAAVIVREDVPGDKRLAAYVTLSPESAADVADLRAFLKTSLPEYMIPAAFVLLDSLPLTSNGKVARNLLPAPELDVREAAEEAPPMPVEELVAQIWSDVLRVEHIGRRENFFELGGHSLLATQVVSRIQSVFQVEMPLRLLFEAPTLIEFSERLEALRRESIGLSVPGMVGTDRTLPLPLSFAQQRLWLINQLDPESSAYNIPVALRLAGPLDTDALERTINEIARRHEVLRTTFRVIDGRPVQVIQPAGALKLSMASLEHLPLEEREERVRQLVQLEAGRAFDLGEGPVLRASLVRLNDQDHAALLTMHHIAGDDWSMGILVKEVAALYAAFSAGKPSPLPELTIQYGDFAVWQRGWLTGEALEMQLAYWRNRLADLKPLEMPTDHPRPAAQSYQGAIVPFPLGPAVSGSLKALGRREGATLFMTLLTAWQMLLARYSGQDDIVVGSPIAGRNRAETEDVIGCFLNTLVMRADLSGHQSFIAVLAQVREACLGAYAHQDIPFEQLVEALAPARDLGRHPIFQVLMDFHAKPAATLSLGDVRFRPMEAESRTAKFDLSLFMSEGAGELFGGIEYATSLFEPATIERMAGHFQNLLLGIVADPDRPISEFALLSAAEGHQLLVAWNDTTRDCPLDVCVHELFTQQAARTPGAVAAVCGDRTLTYAELNARANQLAHYLIEQGVGPEVRVGLLVERSLDMVVALLGILKAGAAYVPLDPALPAERLAFMVSDSAAPVIVAQGKLLDTVSLDQTQIVVSIDRDWDEIARSSDQNPVSDAGPQNLAYVIYTSGSTGTPKGVGICHGGLTNYLSWSTQAYDAASGDGTPVHSSLGFDLTVTSLLPALISGQKVVLLPEDQPHLELERMLREPGDWTLFKITPAHLAVLGEGLKDGDVLGGVQSLVIGGEALHGGDLTSWRARWNNIRIINEYGPTETVVGCCVYDVPDTIPVNVVPIGRPIWNTDLYVLDSEFRPVPVGVPGELYIGGAGVARGYLGRPGLTAERFIPHPFNNGGGARLYRTGDVCRYLGDGNLEYLGRTDHQVKIRGFRIELGEIEAALVQLASVHSSVVIVREDQPGDRRLTAYLVANAGQTIDVAELRAALSARLPEYMVPAAFVVLEALPLTSNGKIDRKALPAPSAEPMEEYAAPRTPTEETLAGIWASVLGIARVGINDDFFTLGGHSLLAMQLISQSRESLGVEVPFRTIFERPTVAGIAEWIAAQNAAPAPAPAPPSIKRASRSGHVYKAPPK